MTAVLLFAKAPRAGYVKTRLAAAVGGERAVEAYRACGTQVARQVGAGFPLVVWYAPADAEGEMRAWLGAHEYRSQVGDDLGARLAHAFATHFAEHPGPVVVVGADAPQVGRHTIDAALRALERADVVLGPALDGGYYLLGLNRLAPSLFEGIPWGTPSVTAVTLSRCRAAGLRVANLPILRDLDTVEDLAALRVSRS